jgi:phosphomannomutase
MKPDVIQQTLQLERDRERMAAEQAQQMNSGGGDNGQIILQQPGQEPVALSNKQVVEIIQQQQGEIQNRDKKIHQMNEEIKKLQFDLYNLRKVVEKNAENADDDNELKIVEIVDKPANVDTTHVTNQDKNTTNCPPDLMKRYEDLLEENREMRRLLDDLTQTNTNAELM